MKLNKGIAKGNQLLFDISWQLISRIINLFCSLVSSIVVVRHLGKYYFGLYSYGLSYVSVFSAIAEIGLENILVSRFSGNNKSDICEYFGTGFLIRNVADIIVFAVCLLTYLLFSKVEETNKIVIPLIIPILFQCLENYRYLYIARYNVREYLIFQNISVLLGLLLRIIGIFVNLGIEYFVIVFVIQSVFVYSSAFVAYLLYHSKEICFVISKSKVFKILKMCVPLSFASIALSVFCRVDQLMVTKMTGYENNGVYSVAVTLSEYWYFIPNLITVTLLPSLTKAYNDSLSIYSDLMQKVLDILVCISYAMILLLILCGKYVIKFMYGSEYLEASSIMSLYIISSLFASLGYGRGLTCSIIGKNGLSLCCVLLGLISNLMLNLLLIPIMGSYGAAIATIVAQLFCGYLGTFLNKNFFYIGKIQTKALFPFVRIVCYFRQWLKN